MRRWLLGFMLVLFMGLGTAHGQQFWEGSLYNSSLGAFVPNVVNFDWAASGSGMAQNLAPAGGTRNVGDTFILRYQAFLTKLENANGQQVSFPGLNTDFEYTVVAEIPQQILAFVPGTTRISLFSTLPGGRFYIYQDSKPNAIVATGLGFDDGNLVASGLIDAGILTQYTYSSSSNSAVGSTILTGQVNFTNPTYITPAMSIVSIRLETTVNFPPLDSTTTHFFVSRPGEGNLAPYAVQSNDLLLKLDASSKFLAQNTCIEIKKQISVDNGQTWLDADTAADAPGTDAIKGAIYRFIVYNCGVTDVNDVVINDPVLGITNFYVANRLAPGEEIILTHAGDVPIPALSQPGICSDFDVPEIQNTATVTGQFNGQTVTDTDSAWVKCVCIDIEKLVSVDGGDNYVDADEQAIAPETTDGAIYKFVVANCGAVDLTDVVLNDQVLGIENVNIGTLFVGESKNFLHNDVNFPAFSALNQPALCDEGLPEKLNIASVAGSYNSSQTTDSDPAWVLCVCGGSIGDFVWNDMNRNGIQDAGEPGISGVTVNLLQGGMVIATTTTNVNGFYQFSGLCAGDYVVEVDATTLPMGYVASPSMQGGDATVDSNGSPANVTLPMDNSQDLTIDFGYYAPCTGSIGDFVWNDMNRNGIQDAGEPGISGVTVNLLQGGMVIATTQTNGQGMYLFSGLCAGDYVVEVDATTLPMGYVASPSFQGGNTALDSNGSPANVTLPMDNSQDPTIDFGYYAPCTGSIGDFVWNDLNRNGIQDAGETGIAGVTVNLLQGGMVIATTTTNVNGFYQFSGLCAGDYVVEVDATTLPMGYVASPSMQGGDATVDSNGSPANVTLPMDNSQDLTIDFGYYVMPATLGDRVWNDANRNGIQDAGEMGIAGVTVNLIDCTTNVVIATTTTDASGLYSFTNLMPGSYRVEFVAPMGYTFTMQNAGADDALDSDANALGVTECVTLAAGETNNTVDAGLYVMPATLGDRVWNDANRNGIQDAGEMGIAGVTVNLVDCTTNVVIATTTTDASGLYSFTNLMPGSYRVEFVAPMGYTFTMQNAGADDALDSDANASGVTDCVTLVAGETNNTVDAGLYQVMAAIDIEKSTNGEDADMPTGPIVAVGSPISWTYVVTNTGNVDLINVMVTDDQGVAVTCPKTTLAVGEFMTCTANGIAMAGQYANIGTAIGYYNDMPVTDTDPSHYYGAAAAIDIEKSTNGEDADMPTGPIVAVGSPISWTYVVTNTGNVDLINVMVTDDQGVAVTCPKTTLAVGEFMTCTANGIAMAGQYANIGTAIGYYNDMPVSDTDPSHYYGAAAAIDIEKSTNGEDADMPTGPIVAVGSPISWTYVVTNTGNVDLINVMVTDDQGVAVTCPKTTLVVGESMTCTANGLAMEGQYANIGTATGYYNDMPVSDTDPSHYYGAAAAIDIEKYTNGEDADMPTGPIVAVGSPISWTYVVTNTGNVPLTNVKVTDNKIGAIMCPQTTLAVGEVMTCTAEGIAMAGQYANIGTATGDHGDMAVTDNDPSHYYGKMPKIDLEKYVSKDGMNWDDADMPKGLIVPVCPDYTQPGGENDCQTKKDHYRSEHDRTKSEYEKKKNDYERSKSDRDKSKSDYDKSCYEKESSKKNHDNKKSSYDKAKSDYERSKTAANKYRMDKAKSEYDYSKSDYDKKSTSCDSKKADYDRKKYDSDQKKSERDKAKSDYDKAKSDWDKYKDKDCGSDYTDKCGTYECESAVYFRFVVTNNGPVTLTELELTDSDYDTGSCVIPESLAPGQSFECIIGPIPAVAGQHTNTGTATGQYGGIYVMDTDDANYFGVVGKGTGTPGYWMNHPEAWPVESITIGGKTYTKSKAISLMKAPSKGGDKLYTMFQALVAAKLNVLSGNVSDCIDATIAAADQWMATYGPIEVKTVSASSTAWKMGEPLYLLLDDYNNGLLCAPSRDCFDKKDVYRSKGTKTTSFWKAKDKSWPTSSVRVGGKTYYKSEALNYLNSSTKKDVTYKMFHALASAKLNMAEGNEKSCIEDRIKSADSWMEKYGPVGRNLAMTTSAWREGEVHFQILDDYNNGKLCSGYSKDVTSTWSR